VVKSAWAGDVRWVCSRRGWTGTPPHPPPPGSKAAGTSLPLPLEAARTHPTRHGYTASTARRRDTLECTCCSEGGSTLRVRVRAPSPLSLKPRGRLDKLPMQQQATVSPFFTKRPAGAYTPSIQHRGPHSPQAPASSLPPCLSSELAKAPPLHIVVCLSNPLTLVWATRTRPVQVEERWGRGFAPALRVHRH
jgi:hypothetical protein